MLITCTANFSTLCMPPFKNEELKATCVLYRHAANPFQSSEAQHQMILRKISSSTNPRAHSSLERSLHDHTRCVFTDPEGTREFTDKLSLGVENSSMSAFERVNQGLVQNSVASSGCKGIKIRRNCQCSLAGVQ